MRISLLLSFLLLLTGCDGDAPAVKPSSRRLSVVATVYPLADLARQVGGELVDVSWVVEAGQSLKGVQPDERLRNQLRTADVVLMGDVTEAWATEGSGGGEHYARILRLEALPIARQNSRHGYLWLDPTIAKEAVNEMSMRLRSLRPGATAEITNRSDALLSKIDELVREYEQRLLGAQNRRLLVLGDEFSPFLSRFSMQAIPTVDVAPTRLTDENVRLIQYQSRQNRTSLLVLPADTPAAVIDEIRVRSGLQIVALDHLGSSAGGGRSNYIELLRWNLDQLVRATTLQ